MIDLGLQISATATTPQKVVTLRIELPPGFPYSIGPSVRILDDGITHPWLDRNGRVIGHPQLLQWRPDFNLGIIIKQTMDEFCTHAPKIITPGAMANGNRIANPSASAMMAQSQGSNHNFNGSLSSSQIEDRLGLPQVPTSFPEVEALGMEELQHLLDSDESFEVFFHSLEIIQNVTTLSESIKADNMDTARQNMEKEDLVTISKDALVSEQEQLRKEKERYDGLQQKIKVMNEKYSPQRIGANLQKIAKKLDRESDDIATAFTRGQISLGDFIKSYVDIRKRYHNIQSKSEKCLKMIN